jgi:hypothetical protein
MNTSKCRYRDGYSNAGSRTGGRDTFLCSVKEKYPKEIRPMPLASYAPSFLSGFARKDIPVLLAKCGFLPHPSGLFPIKPPVLGAA